MPSLRPFGAALAQDDEPTEHESLNAARAAPKPWSAFLHE